MNSKRQYPMLIGLGLTALALGLRLHGLGWGLPEVYEEATPLHQAWDMWNGGATAFDPNPHFFNYPSLVIYLHLLWQCLQLVVFKAAGLIASNLDFRVMVEIEKTPVYYAGRLLTALMGSGTVWLVFQLGRRFAGLAAGTVAAFLLAVNTFHIDQSQVIAVDVPLTFLAMAALLAMTRLGPEARLRDHVWTGVLIGLATSAKYTGAVLIAPYLAVMLFSTGSPRKWWPLGLLGLAVAAAVFALTSPYVVLDGQAAWHSLGVESNHMQQGHFGLGTDAAWYHYFVRLAGGLLGWPTLMLGALGVWFYGVRQQQILLVIPLVFLLVGLGPISTWTMKADRYLLPVIPVFMVLAGCGISALVTLVEQRHWPHGLAVTGVVVITLLGTVPSARTYPELMIRTRPDTRTTTLRWIENNIPAGSFILTEYYGPDLLRPTDLLSLDQALQDRLLTGESRRPVYAVQTLPLFQSRPSASAVYYNLQQCPEADYVLISGSVRSRYARNPRRFAPQLAFYAALESQWKLVREFKPGRGAGPRLQLFRNPRWSQPYAERTGSTPVPLPPEPNGQLRDEGFFFFSLGANALTFDHPDQAEQAFRLGLRYQPLRPEIARNLLLGVVKVNVGRGRADRATAFLDSLAREGRTDLRPALTELRDKP